jgi:uncharacterized protein YggU (UPF0235/DUF167 family)
VWDGTRLELWVGAPPVDGAANVAAVEAVAAWLGVPRRAVRLVSGAASRTKIFDVEGIAALPAADGPAR